MSNHNKNLYKTFFDSMAIPRFVVEPGKANDYVIVESNLLALKYFDLPSEKVLGYTIEKILSAESAAHFFQCFEVCLKRKQSVSIRALPGVPSDVRVHGFYISPVTDQNGEVLYLDVIGQPDISDRSMLQRERDDAISLVTSIFEVSEIGIIVSDHNARVVRVNDSFLRTFGWQRSDLLNKDMMMIVEPDERDLMKKNHEEFIRSGKHGAGELTLIAQNGTIANVLFTTATLELSQKRRFQVTTFMDITQRKQMEESLRFAKEEADAANRAKSTFLANMSHELRTPLNAIIGFSEMMIKEIFGPLGHDKYAEYMEDIRGSAKHLVEIINEVLDMSKIEAGRVELEEDRLNVKGMLESVTRMMLSRVFDSDLEFKLNVQEGLPDIYADPRLVRQLLINLVTNAVKFSNPEGEIEMSARHLDDGRVRIVISDQGIGIPQEKIKEALQPFGQVSDAYDRAGRQGTGLGLPLAKAMIELHDGTLEIESEVGRGTRVLVTFPANRVLDG